MDSKAEKEGMVHNVFAHVGFWPEKLNINCSEGVMQSSAVDMLEV